MTAKLSIVHAALALANVGCTPSDSAAACEVEGASDPTPRLGLALLDGSAGDLVTLEDGGTVEVVRGLQGGLMHFLGARVTRLEAGRPSCVGVSIDVSGLDEDVATYTSIEPLELGSNPSDVGPYPVLLSFDLASLVGRMVTIDAVVDGGGAGAETRRTVRLVDEE